MGVTLEPDELTLTSRDAVARFFGVFTTTIKGWLVRGMPREKKGKSTYSYPLASIVQWRRELDQSEGNKGDQERRDLQNRLLSIKAELEGMRLSEAKGELVNPHDLLQDFLSALGVLK